MDWKPKVLCLGAGGIKGLDELGAIWWFWSNGNLTQVDTYIGSSIGAIIGALMAMGWSPQGILEYAIDTSLFNDLSEIQITQVMSEFGLMPNSTFDDALAKRLTDMIVKKLGKIPTLLEFHQLTGKRVIFTIVSLKQEKAIYADHLSHPDMSLMTALRSTSNTPLIFGKLEHQKDYLVDGAIIDPFPVRLLDDGNTPILAIGVVDRRVWQYKAMSALSYYERITSLPLRELTEFAIANASDQCYCLLVPVTDEAGMLQMGSRESRLQKFLSGYFHVEKHLITHPFPSRRIELQRGEAPLTPAAIRACFRTHAAKLILRCMKEDPTLFAECLAEHGIEVPARGIEVSSLGETPVPQVDTSRAIIPLPSVLWEDDVIEIPRFPHPLRPQRMPSMGFTVLVNIDPVFLDEIFHLMLTSVRRFGALSGGLPLEKIVPKSRIGE